MAAWTDFAENKLVDFLFRNQALGIPAGNANTAGITNLYVGLLTAAPSDTGGGTEVSTTSTGYARVAVANSLANWAGTQSAGSTTASTGTSGTTSNNNAVTFGAPSANWGNVTHFAIFDASTGGNMLVYGALTTAKTVNNGDAAPSFAAGALTFTIDN